MIGPPGVVTIDTKHHRSGRLELDGDTLTVNGRPSDYVRKARLEGLRAAELLRAALADAGQPGPGAPLEVRPVIVVVGGRPLPRRWPVGVTVVMGRQLVHALRSMPERWDPVTVAAVFDIARRSTTWTLRRPPRA